MIHTFYKFIDKIVEVLEVIANDFGKEEFEKDTGINSEDLKLLINNFKNFDKISDKEKYNISSVPPSLFLKACIIIDPIEIEIVTSSTWEDLMSIYKKMYSRDWKNIT